MLNLERRLRSRLNSAAAMMMKKKHLVVMDSSTVRSTANDLIIYLRNLIAL